MARDEWDSLNGHCFTYQRFSNRRGFLKESAVFTAGFSTLLGASLMPEAAQASDSNLNILGPKPGYGPQVGTFVSMLTWMREANGVISATKGLTQADLDYLVDRNANTIGALMLHLAAPLRPTTSSTPSKEKSGIAGRIL